MLQRKLSTTNTLITSQKKMSRRYYSQSFPPDIAQKLFCFRSNARIHACMHARPTGLSNCGRLCLFFFDSIFRCSVSYCTRLVVVVLTLHCLFNQKMHDTQLMPLSLRFHFRWSLPLTIPVLGEDLSKQTSTGL